VSAIPSEDGRSAIFQVREVGGKPASLALQNQLSGAPLDVQQVDATGLPVPKGRAQLEAWESGFFRVRW
jgi:hypothetical protein